MSERSREVGREDVEESSTSPNSLSSFGSLKIETVSESRGRMRRNGLHFSAVLPYPPPPA